MPFKDDFWTLNGTRVFGSLPGKLLNRDNPVPIFLQHGDMKWGAVHIAKRHGSFVIRNSVGAPRGHAVPWVVWRKLQQPGSIWTAEEAGKLKVSLPLDPSTLLVLQLNEDAEPFFGVTTLYSHGGRIDGSSVGRYVGRKWPTGMQPPTFELVYHLI